MFVKGSYYALNEFPDYSRDKPFERRLLWNNQLPNRPKTITIALSSVMGRSIELRLFHRQASKKRNNRLIYVSLMAPCALLNTKGNSQFRYNRIDVTHKRMRDINAFAIPVGGKGMDARKENHMAVTMDGRRKNGQEENQVKLKVFEFRS